MKRLALAAASALALAVAAPAVAQSPDFEAITAQPLNFNHRTLANGLNVYTMPDPTAGTVTVQVWYDVGAKNDPAGRSGFAHLFEHILSRKTVNMPLGTMNKLVEDVGGTRNASTGSDFTNYYETVPPQYLQTMLWTHAERMARPVVDQAVFEAERDIVKEELRQRVLAEPYGRLQRFVMWDNAWDSSIYRRPGIGSIEELDSAVIEDARAFHEAYYRPATATLIVSGNFDQAQLDGWIDQYFAPIQAPTDRPVPVMERPPFVQRTEPRSVVAYAPNVPLPQVVAMYQGVPSNSADAAALDVMSAIMSSGESSRLYQSLVYDQQVAVGAGLYSSTQEEGGYIVASATVATGKTPDEAEAALNTQIQAIRDGVVTEAELNEAKIELLASDLRSRETPSGRAFLLGRAIVGENNANAPDERLAAIKAVTAADVQRVAREYLNESGRVSIRYLDESQRPEGEADAWASPAPMPDFITVPAAINAPNELAAEDVRQAPPAPSAPIEAAPPIINERTLSNGLRVIVAKSTDLPIINAQLVINGGSSADPADRLGLASMTAGLATQGAGGMTAPEIAQKMEVLGASIGGGAGSDATTLFFSAPIATAEQAAAIAAKIVTDPTFDAAEIERARKQSLDGLRVSMTQPGTIASRVLYRMAYGAAPYGAPASGTAETVSAITAADIDAFHDQWWRPNNATLIITGGMDAEAGFALAESMLGDWQSTAGVVTTPARAGQALPPRVVVVDLPGAGQAAVTAAVRAPVRNSDAWYPLAVANAVMGGGSNGRLFQEVRAKRGLSYGAYSALGARAEGGLLSASTQTKNESAAEVVGLVLAEFDRLGAEVVTEDQVEARETFLAGGFLRSIETTGGLGGVLSDAVQYGIPLDEVTHYPGRIRATTPETLQAAAQAAVSSDQAYVVVVGDASMFVDALRQTHPDLVVIPAAELDLNDPTLGIQ